MTELSINANSETASERLSPSNLPYWYAVHVWSTFQVAHELTAKRLENHLPAVTEVHDWKYRNNCNDMPLFPGYVFTRFCDSSASRLVVLRNVATTWSLGFQHSIESIPDAESESSQQVLQANVLLLIDLLLREGSLVRVIQGLLKDLLVRIKNQPRPVTSVELLSRSVSTNVNLRDLKVVGAALLELPPQRPAEYYIQIQ